MWFIVFCCKNGIIVFKYVYVSIFVHVCVYVYKCASCALPTYYVWQSTNSTPMVVWKIFIHTVYKYIFPLKWILWQRFRNHHTQAETTTNICIACINISPVGNPWPLAQQLIAITTAPPRPLNMLIFSVIWMSLISVISSHWH